MSAFARHCVRVLSVPGNHERKTHHGSYVDHHYRGVRLFRGLETRRGPARDEVGEGRFAEERAQGISPSANGARRLAEPEWTLGLRDHGQRRGERTDKMDWKDSRAVPD